MKYENSDGVSHSSLDSGTPFQNSTPFENLFSMKFQIPASLSRFNTTPSRKSHTTVNGLRRSLRAVVLASLCGLAAIPAPAVTSVASNLKVSVNGDKVVLSWTGTQAFCTRHEATRV